MENSDSVVSVKQQENSVGPFRKYIYGNPLAVLWNSVLTFGGFLFLIYFWSIQYFPILDLGSATALLAATAITGFGITVLFAFMLVIPGWVHREILCDIDKSLLNEEGAPDRVTLFFAMPMAAGAMMFWAVSQNWGWCAYLPILAAFVILLMFFGGDFGRDAGTSIWRTILRSVRLLIAPILNAFIFVATSWFVVLLFAAKFEKIRPTLDEAVWVVFFAMTVIVILVNAIIAKSGNKRLWLVPVAAIVSLFVLLLLTQQPTMIPSAAVRILKLGGFSANLILDQQGSQIAQQFIESTAPSVTAAGAAQTKPNKDAVGAPSLSGGCVVRSINILSRVGTEYYLETQPPEVSTQKPESKWEQIAKSRFIIPSSHILSWEAIERGKETATLLVCTRS